ncbi:MAG TPA: septation ring formation regulator EzrA [Candidatus Angelobacter sp.]|nr:septation ring formation regulator EzrA [Candidatus Angelobacter sp.]
MIYAIMGLIIVIGLVVVYGALMRRKIYQDVDRMANWKINVINRPITDEISKVKNMTMGGETEQKFEVWRRDWDEILTHKLPMVEEMLFEAEEYADKYRFKRSREVLIQTQRKMDEIEHLLSKMLEDLQVVVESEEQNKKNIVPIKERFHELRKTLLTKRGEFKEAIGYLESKLSSIEKQLAQHEEETANGNVILARDILGEVAVLLEELEKQVLDVPKLYKDIRVIIPYRLKELDNGVTEMLEDGYLLEHLKIEEFKQGLHNHLHVYEQGMQKATFDDVAEGLEETFEQLEWIYNQLEKEVETRHLLKKELPVFEHDLELVGQNILKMNEEMIEVQKSYILEERDFKTQESLDRVYKKLEKEFEEVDLVYKENHQAFSILFEKVEDMRGHLKELHANAKTYREKLDTLRKDEWKAKEILQGLKQKLIESRRRVQKSNLPGLPQSYITILDDANECLTDVKEALDQKPLDMEAIQRVLDEADHKVSLVLDKTIEMAESAILTEKLIQYGNRFRRSYNHVDAELKRAEAYFRSYNFVEAVEVAASAVESVDPGVTKRFTVELESHIS